MQGCHLRRLQRCKLQALHAKALHDEQAQNCWLQKKGSAHLEQHIQQVLQQLAQLLALQGGSKVGGDR